MPAMYVDLDEWLKVTSSWRMRSRSPSPHNILIRPASSSHIVPNRSITAGQKSKDTPAANGPYFLPTSFKGGGAADTPAPEQCNGGVRV
jgi:hypothetical protein